MYKAYVLVGKYDTKQEAVEALEFQELPTLIIEE